MVFMLLLRNWFYGCFLVIVGFGVFVLVVVVFVIVVVLFVSVLCRKFWCDGFKFLYFNRFIFVFYMFVIWIEVFGVIVMVFLWWI